MESKRVAEDLFPEPEFPPECAPNRYRIVGRICQGGMASVYLARVDGPFGFQKWIAIKRVHPHLASDESFARMFFDEARLAARLHHPNLTMVFDVGRDDETYWLAMEYLHGESLGDVMRRANMNGAPIPYGLACRLIAEAAEGLHTAHELRDANGALIHLVHRDVTPPNLLVTYDGTLKVLDFGIAKFASRLASTEAGIVKGKFAYMSPEQARGGEVDRRTDVFSLGIVLWEMTTGRRLFRAASPIQALAMVEACVVPRPSTLAPDYPPLLEEIVLRALGKDPDHRYDTAAQMADALHAFLVSERLSVSRTDMAEYMRSIFSDRMRQRDERLRMASEFTEILPLPSSSRPTLPAAFEYEDVTVEQASPMMSSSRDAHPVPVASGTMPAAPQSAPRVREKEVAVVRAEKRPIVRKHARHPRWRPWVVAFLAGASVVFFFSAFVLVKTLTAHAASKAPTLHLAAPSTAGPNFAPE